jgi:hypothetical protein
MSELVADCPRCTAAKITFNLIASTKVGQQHGWQNWHGLSVFAGTVIDQRLSSSPRAALTSKRQLRKSG